MRYDIREDHSLMNVKVFLDGVELDNCIWADTDIGEVGCYKASFSRDDLEIRKGVVTVEDNRI